MSEVSLKNIEICGLKGFREKQVLDLAEPTGEPGSGLTILVGPNNAGKSTVIDALSYFNKEAFPSFSVGIRNQGAGSRVSLKVTTTANKVQEIRTVAAGGSGTERIPAGQSFLRESLLRVPSRRYFSAFFGRSTTNRSHYAGQWTTDRDGTIREFPQRLFQIHEDPEKRKAFEAVLGKVIDPLPNWTIELSDAGSHYLRFASGDADHNSDGLGDGIISLFFLIDALYDSEPGNTIVIDEPELSLHPALQRKIADLFHEYASDRQIVCATHSPYFVDLQAIVHGARVARLHRKNDSCTISMLSREAARGIQGLLRDHNNPHVLGMKARETFFLDDGIILVEGQEDVVDYPEILKQLDFKKSPGTFFGWGVGGASKMDIVARILSNLGFEKVAGIVDDDKKHLIPELQQDFPQYRFFSIPAANVRTKPQRAAQEAKLGLLDEERKIKENCEKPLRELFTSINTFFNVDTPRQRGGDSIGSI